MKMKFLVVIICAAAAMVSPITVSSNGNSPKIKMVGGMMVDVDEPNPAPLKPVKETNSRIKGDPQKFLKLNDNSTKLSINERYRRLIPYMTFYYANDLATPITDVPKSFEVEKAEIVQTHTLEQSRREPKKIYYSINRNIPRYEGNRLTEHNIASANPTKYFYKDAPVYQNLKITPAYNPLLNGQDINGEFGKYIQKPLIKSPSVPFSAPTRKPYLNLYENDNSPNVRYYVSDEKEQAPKYKLVPYEQTPPVKFVPQNVNFYNTHKKTPVFPIDESFSNSPKIQNFYENPQRIVPVRKQPFTISESYYEKSRPQAVIGEPVVEGGFKPIVNVEYTTKTPLYDLRTPLPHFESEKHHSVKIIETISEKPSNTDYKPNYYQYVTETPSYTPEPTYVSPNSLTLTDLIRTLQLNKSIPEAITRENVGSSIRTLLQVLNALRAVPQHNEVDTPILSTPTPFVATKPIEVSVKPVVHTTLAPIDTDIQGEHHLADINTPSQHLDDYSPNMGTSQQFPPPVNSDDEGGTPGKPGVDYPILTIIPPTKFNCKTQRYKGFFADPETRCQVWHYCDLNGGQASFLCPNGTIFSQAALTCDWWFNVKCASTTQLYVLNESLYKYILPHSPKFPEDYSGPLVDKYLTLKFKEMEEQFKKNKNRQSAAEKIDSGEAFDKMDSDVEKEDTDSTEKAVESDVGSVSEPSVIVELPGTSGNVARLDD